MNIMGIPWDIIVFFFLNLVGGDWNMTGLWLSIQLGISSSQLTNSIIFQRGRSTTNQLWKMGDGHRIKKRSEPNTWTPSGGPRSSQVTKKSSQEVMKIPSPLPFPLENGVIQVKLHQGGMRTEHICRILASPQVFHIGEVSRAPIPWKLRCQHQWFVRSNGLSFFFWSQKPENGHHVRCPMVTRWSIK